MYYDINVALNGRHFFATHERSVTDLRKLCEVYHTIKAKFPESEGYTVTVSHVVTSGTPINPEAIK